MPGFIGLPEIILLGLVALILFGPKRLPELGRGLGKGMREFKESIGGDHGLNEAKLEVPTELTAAPTVPEPIATAAADRRNAA
jgi:sec-independent protein translocase protein TatA